MISHDYQCIFIHLPRTGGTSIDYAVTGKDWWEIDKTTKHLTAAQAKSLYADYWNDYYKFAFVRDPADRMLSCMRFGGYFSAGTEAGCSFAEFLEGYMRRFGFPVTIEYDYRFGESYTLDNPIPNAVYRNMLGDELDFIGRFETLEDDIAHIARTLNITNISMEQHAATHFLPKTDPFTTEEIELLEQLFRNDLDYFDLELPDPGDRPM